MAIEATKIAEKEIEAGQTPTYTDLREWLEIVESLGQLKKVDGVDWNLEMGTLSELIAQGTKGPVPAILYDNIKDYPEGVTETLLRDPMKVLVWTSVAFVANPLLQLLAYIGFIWRGSRHAKTLALLSGNRNMGLVLAALPPASNEGILLFFALAQLPMYMLPTILRSFYQRN